MSVRFLDGAAVRSFLSIKLCVPLMRQAMLSVARGEAVQPIRQVMHQPDGRGLLGLMPGYIEKPCRLGIKIISVFEDNKDSELGSHQGVVLIFDSSNGSLVAVLDARHITAIRTAAATAVATDVLARDDVRSLGMIGYGEQAREHIPAMMHVRDFQEIKVWGRDFDKAQAFAARESKRLGQEIDAVRNFEDVVSTDVICTTTAAREPFLAGASLRPGQHVNLVGASVPTAAEADTEAVRRARYFTDFKDSALQLAGEFRRAKAAGVVADDHILGSIGEILDGSIIGRSDPKEITIFKSLGMIAEDLFAADFILAEAERTGAGQLVQWSV